MNVLFLAAGFSEIQCEMPDGEPARTPLVLFACDLEVRRRATPSISSTKTKDRSQQHAEDYIPRKGSWVENCPEHRSPIFPVEAYWSRWHDDT